MIDLRPVGLREVSISSSCPTPFHRQISIYYGLLSWFVQSDQLYQSHSLSTNVISQLNKRVVFCLCVCEFHNETRFGLKLVTYFTKSNQPLALPTKSCVTRVPKVVASKLEHWSLGLLDAIGWTNLICRISN